MIVENGVSVRAFDDVFLLFKLASDCRAVLAGGFKFLGISLIIKEALDGREIAVFELLNDVSRTEEARECRPKVFDENGLGDVVCFKHTGVPEGRH